MKHILSILLVTITLFSQSYIYEDENALSPMIGTGIDKDYFSFSAGIDLTLYGRLDLFAAFTKHKLSSNNNSFSYYSSYKMEEVERKAYGLSYEFISIEKNIVAASITLHDAKFTSLKSTTVGLTHIYKKSDNNYILSGLSYTDQEKDAISASFGYGMNLDLNSVNLLFEAGLILAFPEGGDLNAGFGISIITSIPFL